MEINKVAFWGDLRYTFKSHHSGMEMGLRPPEEATDAQALNRTIVGWK